MTPADRLREPVVHIRGTRVLLGPIEPEEHLDNYIRWLNDPEVTRWLLRYLPLARLEEKEWLERAARGSSEQVAWAVYDESGRHIGGTGLHDINWHDRSAISGTVIGDKSAWGKGYGREVMQLRTRYAFEELGLHRLESECFVENVASAKCLESAGYRQVGIARKRRWRHGSWHDTILWEMLHEDFAELTGG